MTARSMAGILAISTTSRTRHGRLVADHRHGRSEQPVHQLRHRPLAVRSVRHSDRRLEWRPAAGSRTTGRPAARRRQRQRRRLRHRLGQHLRRRRLRHAGQYAAAELAAADGHAPELHRSRRWSDQTAVRSVVHQRQSRRDARYQQADAASPDGSAPGADQRPGGNAKDGHRGADGLAGQADIRECRPSGQAARRGLQQGDPDGENAGGSGQHPGCLPPGPRPDPAAEPVQAARGRADDGRGAASVAGAHRGDSSARERAGHLG